MKKAATRVVVLVDDGKSGAAYRAGNPLHCAELLYKGGLAGAKGAMKGEYGMVTGLFPKGMGGGGDIIETELDFHGAKVKGKLQRGRYINSLHQAAAR
jgi:hypothetical protein